MNTTNLQTPYKVVWGQTTSIAPSHIYSSPRLAQLWSLEIFPIFWFITHSMIRFGKWCMPTIRGNPKGLFKAKKKQPETNLLLRPYYRQQMHPRGQSSHCTNRPRLVAIPQCPLIKLLQIRSPLDNQAAVGDSLKRGSEALYLTTWTLCLATPVLRLAEEM